jgi:hypothetical protein
VYLPWWLSHWEEYHTGVLMYGDGNYGILEVWARRFGSTRTARSACVAGGMGRKRERNK